MSTNNDLLLRSLVRIEGLKSKPELNGTRGTISTAMDAASGRWQVKCAHDGETRALKPANIALALAASASARSAPLSAAPYEISLVFPVVNARCSQG